MKIYIRAYQCKLLKLKKNVKNSNIRRTKRTCKSLSSDSLLSNSIFMSLTCTLSSRALLFSMSLDLQLLPSLSILSATSSWSFNFAAPDGFLDWDRIYFEELFSKPCAEVKEESESRDREFESVEFCGSFTFDDVPSFDLWNNWVKF